MFFSPLLVDKSSQMRQQTIAANMAFLDIQRQEQELRDKLSPYVKTLEKMTEEERAAIEKQYGMPINRNPTPYDPTKKRRRFLRR